MGAFIDDIRQATRRLLSSPGYAIVAVLTLAVGIGASVAIYTVIDHVLLHPMPYPDPDRLVRVKSPVPMVGPDVEWETSTAEYFYFREHATTVDAVADYFLDSGTLQTPDGPQRVYVASGTASLLPLLGARPVLGRLFDDRDDRPDAPFVAVLSHGFWERQFGGDRGVIGTTVRLQDQPVEVIGVMAPGVELPPEPGQEFAANADLWVPMQIDPAGPFYNSHTSHRMLLHLRPGVELSRAQAEFSSLVPGLPDAYPTAYGEKFIENGFTARLYPLKDYVVGSIAGNLWIVFGAVGLVLLIALANAANLFLVRTEGRRREIAVRAALGAGRGAIARHFLAEGAVLSGLGAGLGLLIGYAGLSWLLTVAPAGLPRLDEVRFGGSVFIFATGVAVLVAVCLSAVPVFHAGRVQGIAALAEGGRGGTASRERQRARSTLVVTQVALALVLIVGATLLLESFRRLRDIDPGFRADGVLTVRLSASPNRYDRERIWGFYHEVLERVRALPGVESAGMVNDGLPLSGFGCTVQAFEDPAVYERLHQANEGTCAGQSPATPGYFETMGIPLLRGRTFRPSDNDAPSTGAVVVSRAFADRFWPGEDPIGKGVAPNGMSEGPFYHVVGLVGDVPAETVEGEKGVAIYYPIEAIPPSHAWWPYGMDLVVRTRTGEPTALVPATRRAVLAVDPTVPVFDPQEMQAILDQSMSRLSFTMVLLGVAAAVALFLAAVGLYGVISYLVTRRTSEIGVRMALGAEPASVQRLVVRGSLLLVGFGLGAGVLGALAATRVLTSLLYGVRPTSPTAYVAAAAVLAAVAVLASWIPARRASRVDPVVALRAE